ncbi:hypothetical protein FJZ36_18145, partial [Candidatus Poribacteria bacterium]|nr:hypothetical protein [Candidatus Poribacteria bacterium]
MNRPARMNRRWLSALAGVGLVAAALAVGSALMEVRQRGRAMRQLFEGQAAILTEVLGDAALHAARASDALESTTTRRLEDLLILLDK